MRKSLGYWGVYLQHILEANGSVRTARTELALIHSLILAALRLAARANLPGDVLDHLLDALRALSGHIEIKDVDLMEV